MNIRIILFLLILSNVGFAWAMICPYATRRITSYFAFQVNLIYGKNTTCSDDQEIHFRDIINDAMTNLNLTKAGGPSRVFDGDICTDANSTVDNHDHYVLIRNLLVMKTFTWVGRAACQLCSTDRKLRGLGEQRVAAEELRIAAEEAARLASNDLTNLITITYVRDPASCLHDDWATVVVVRVTETTKTDEGPCE